MVAAAFLLGSFIESVFGFAGTLIALLLINTFATDVKSVLLVSIIASFTANIMIILTGHSAFSWEQFRKVFPKLLVGIVIGSITLNFLDSDSLLKVFAVFIILLAGLNIFGKSRIDLPAKYKDMFIMLSGVIHGIVGVGGPFLITVIRDDMHKSEMRSTLAGIFLIGNSARLITFVLAPGANLTPLHDFWWLPILLLIPVLIGYKVHITLSQKVFNTGISLLMIIAGVYYMF